MTWLSSAHGSFSWPSPGSRLPSAARPGAERLPGPVPGEAAPAARLRQPLLAVQDLTVLRPRGRPALDGVSLQIAGGEILGIAGVEGNGQSELADVLAGLCHPAHGALAIDGRPLPLGQVPVRVLPRDAVVAAGPRAAVGSPSRRILHRQVMARELGAQALCLVANQPTRGVDVGAAQRLHSALLALRDCGWAVLLLSADIDELLALSDRIAVLFEGRLVAHFAADAVSTRTLGLYMTGAFGTQAIAARLDAPFTPGLPAARGG